MMNIICSLIALLMGVAQFTDISLLEYLPPAEAAVDDSSTPAAEKPRWNNDATIDALVNITPTGFQVSLFGKMDPGPYFFEVPKGPEGYDFKGLKARLAQAHDKEIGDPIGVDSAMNDNTGRMESFNVYRYRDAREISITAPGTTDFQTIVQTMDACHDYESNGTRKELFPTAMLKQFQ